MDLVTSVYESIKNENYELIQSASADLREKVLIRTIDYGDYEIVTWLTNNMDIDINQSDSWPFRRAAVRYRNTGRVVHKQIVLFLIKKSRFPSLVWTIRKRIECPEILNALINHPSTNLNYIDESEDECTPLTAAIQNQSLKTVKLLLNRGADPGLKIYPAGCTPLYVAVKNGNEDIVSYLISTCSARQLKVNHATCMGNTVLMKAIRYARPGTSITLLKRFPHLNVNRLNSNGVSALLLAVERGLWTVTGMLLDRGANPNTAFHRGYKIHKIQLNLAIMLIERGANPNAILYDGLTVLNTALCENMDAVAKLLDHGADLNYQDLNGDTPLMVAIRSDNIPEQIMAEADVNMANNEGNTALMEAVEELKADSVSLLLKTHPELDINYTNNLNMTALMIAVENCAPYEHGAPLTLNESKSFDILWSLLENRSDHDMTIENIEGVRSEYHTYSWRIRQMLDAFFQQNARKNLREYVNRHNMNLGPLFDIIVSCVGACKSVDLKIH